MEKNINLAKIEEATREIKEVFSFDSQGWLVGIKYEFRGFTFATREEAEAYLASVTTK